METPSAGLGAAVDGCALADVHVVSDLYICDLAVELEVLRDSSDYRSWEYAAVLAHLDIVEDRCVRKDPCAVSDLYMLFNICVRSDFYILAELGVRMYCCEWMNVCHVGLFYVFREWPVPV